MVQDEVEHELELRVQGPDVLPAAEVGPDRQVILDREAVVARVREEGEQVKAGEALFQMPFRELAERRQRVFLRVLERVRVGDQQGVV